jgi:hypothetical protein
MIPVFILDDSHATLQISETKNLAVAGKKIPSKLCKFPLIQEIKIPQPLFEAITSNHFHVFTFILPFSRH